VDGTYVFGRGPAGCADAVASVVADRENLASVIMIWHGPQKE
jgi:hypothetical protein